MMKAHNSRPYNPDLAGTFYRAGYIEAWGGGTQKNCEKPLNAYMICFLYVKFELIKSHTTKGAEIIQQRVRLNDRAIFEYAYDIARHHHEKYDGNGYPDGLKGDEISIAAQIVSLVDVYDALTSKRVYKRAYEPDKAFQMILNGHSGVFSPKLLKAFTEVKPRFESLMEMYQDEI